MTGINHRFQGKHGLAYIGYAVLMLVSSLAMAGDVTVETVEGKVQFRHDSTQSWQTARSGANLATPVEFQTGPEAAARVSESGTSFDISANSRLALSSDDEAPAGLVTRVKQWLGTVFYDVERQPDTFKAETPFLVATVKGTQFTIVTTETSSFVTLKEGSLEVVDLETGDTRLLAPGDIAGVTTSQAGIDSLQQTPDALSPAQQQLAMDLALTDTPLNLDEYSADTVLSTLGSELSASLALNLDADLSDSIGAEVTNDVGTDIGADAVADLGDDVGVDVGEDLGVDVGANVGDDLGVDVGANVGDDLGVDVGANVGDDLGVDVGANVGDDLGIDVGADVGDDLGVDVGANVGDDLGVDVGADVGDDLGVDVGADVGDDLGVDVGADVGDDLGVDVGADVGDDLGVDLDNIADSSGVQLP